MGRALRTRGRSKLREGPTDGPEDHGARQRVIDLGRIPVRQQHAEDFAAIVVHSLAPLLATARRTDDGQADSLVPDRAIEAEIIVAPPKRAKRRLARRGADREEKDGLDKGGGEGDEDAARQLSYLGVCVACIHIGWSGGAMWGWTRSSRR